MAAFDIADLLSDIRGRGGIPSADIRFTDAKLMAAATLELRDSITPLLVEAQADRQVYLADVAVTAGTATYRLPSRAVAGRWQSLGWKQTGTSSYTRLRHLSGSAYYLQSDTEQGSPVGFIVRDYSVTLVPTPNVAGTLRLPYYMRPNALVALADAGRVTAVNTGTNTLTLGNTPGTFLTGLSYDVVRGTPGFETLLQSQTGTIGGGAVVLSPGGVGSAGVAVGDYVCLEGQSPFAQCPVEVRALLATRAARRALKSVGEASQAAMLDADVEELTTTARGLLSPRVDEEPKEFGDIRRGLLYGVL